MKRSLLVSPARRQAVVTPTWHSRWAASGVLALIGAFALALGALVYLFDRDPARSLLLPALAAVQAGPYFGVFGLWLPTFVHVLAFSLFSAALLAPQARWAYGACGFWLMVNAAFEIGQHARVRGPLADALTQGLGDSAFVQALANYFLRGTFDGGDLVAAALGAALAASLLRRSRLQLENHHVQ